MKNSLKKPIKKCTEKIGLFCALLFLFMTLFTSISDVRAQADSGTSVTKQQSGPSLQNMKKTGSAMTEEVRKMKEKQNREEILGYVYMVLGFGFVIFLAWFLTVKARKMQEKKDEKKKKFLEAKVANQPKSGSRSVHHKRDHRR